LGLVFYEMITGELPRYPFHWPFVGKEKFYRRVPRSFRKVIRKALEFKEEDRFPDAKSMYHDVMGWSQRTSGVDSPSRKRLMPWRKYREYEFSERFQKILILNYRCCKCNGPISEYMIYCPWCGSNKNSFKGITSFPSVCRACHHGIMEEWDYCPWCYGKKFSWSDAWVKNDKRYVKKCPNKYCGERKVMLWMHYCPWCHAKLKPWKHPHLKGSCKKCKWSIAEDYWEYCPWCGEAVTR
jgi:serine/threonine protein kinase